MEAATEVFIYYASESAPDEAERRNYEVVLSWLRASDKPKCRQIADQLERDLRLFHLFVDDQVETIQRLLPAVGRQLNAAIFTNRLARQGRFLFFRAGMDHFSEAEFHVEPHPHPVLRSNPLATPSGLKMALQKVAELFSTNDHSYILLTKSHGTKKLAITPRLCVRSDEANPAQLVAVAVGEIPEAERPAWAARLGISKDEYLSILAEAGQKSGMNFSLVLLESCESELTDELKAQVPRNVRRMCVASPNAVKYANLDYPQVFLRHADGQSFAEALEKVATAKFSSVQSGDEFEDRDRERG